MRLRPQGYALDWGTLRWCQFYDSPPSGCYDAEMIALHELGHAQSLRHADEADVTTWTDTIMHGRPRRRQRPAGMRTSSAAAMSPGCRSAIRPLSSTTPYSTCLDLPSTLALGTSSSSVTSGATVTLTATLAVSDDATYAKLAGDAVDGRRVTLQRRIPGGSWSNVGSMSALSDGTGRYRTSVSISATYDWRASFNTPSDEGLEGSSSSPIRISVTLFCLASSGTGELVPLYPIC